MAGHDAKTGGGCCLWCGEWSTCTDACTFIKRLIPHYPGMLSADIKSVFSFLIVSGIDAHRGTININMAKVRSDI